MATLAEIKALTAKYKVNPDVTSYVKWANAIIEQKAKKGCESATDIFCDMKKMYQPSPKECQLICDYFKKKGFTVDYPVDGSADSITISWS